jgi:hypothetical protein
MDADEKARFDAEPRGTKRMEILRTAWSRFLQSADGRLWRQAYERPD